MKIDDIDEAAEILITLNQIDLNGSIYLINGNEVIRYLGNALWEIKKGKNRFYYCYIRGNKVYILHACAKQKNKADKRDFVLGHKRMKEIKQLHEVQNEHVD